MKKKINRSFGNVTYESLPKWTDEELSAIKLIEKKYNFVDLNLEDQLLDIFEKIHALSYLTQQNPSEKEQITYIEEINYHVEQLLRLLAPENIGKKIKKRITNVSPTAKYIFIFFNRFLTSFNFLCVKAISTIKKPSRKHKNLKKLPNNDASTIKKGFKIQILIYLKMIFEEGSTLQPRAYTNNCNTDGYGGNLYNFILDIKDLVESKLGINFGSNATIGTYLKKI